MRQPVRSPRRTAVAALGALAAGLLIGHPGSAAAASSHVPGIRVIVSTITQAGERPAFGARVRVHGGRRVYVSARDGFTLVDVRGGLVPARTIDGGQVWRIDGPSLYIPGAADSANTIDDFDAQTPSLIYADGGGDVVDITSDGGRVWRRAVFPGLEAGVLPVEHGLLAYVEDFSTRDPRQITIRRFVTTDGGRSWRLVVGQGTGVQTQRWAPRLATPPGDDEHVSPSAS